MAQKVAQKVTPEEILRECQKHDTACHRAVWAYIAAILDPCGLGGPPKMSSAERLHYMKFLHKYGRPQCDASRLIRRAAERLGLRLGDDIIERAAKYARILRATGTTWRVAAAAGLVAAAREAGIYVPVADAAFVMRCTETAVREALRRLRLEPVLQRINAASEP